MDKRHRTNVLEGGKMNDTERLNWLEKQDGGALISDDMGHWAFASDGIQNLPSPDDKYFDLATTHFVEKHAFRDSIREAIDHAIKQDIMEK